jgi:hypothetical protein
LTHFFRVKAGVISGFVLSSTPLPMPHDYPPPEVPASFNPMHIFANDNTPVMAVPDKNLYDMAMQMPAFMREQMQRDAQQKLNAQMRGRILGEASLLQAETLQYQYTKQYSSNPSPGPSSMSSSSSPSQKQPQPLQPSPTPKQPPSSLSTSSELKNSSGSPSKSSQHNNNTIRSTSVDSQNALLLERKEVFPRIKREERASPTKGPSEEQKPRLGTVVAPNFKSSTSPPNDNSDLCIHPKSQSLVDGKII